MFIHFFNDLDCISRVLESYLEHSAISGIIRLSEIDKNSTVPERVFAPGSKQVLDKLFLQREGTS